MRVFRVEVDSEGAPTMEDAAGFFANVFGGERFRDYVSLPHSPFSRLVCVPIFGGANSVRCGGR